MATDGEKPAESDKPTRADKAPQVPRPDVFRMEMAKIEQKSFPRPQGEYRVVIERPVYEAILAHGRSNLKIELCGILVGDLARDAAGPYLVVTEVIRGKAAREEAHNVTFTHSTWEHIHKEMDQKHAGRRIVGWYHMHPGFGVFLSEVDLFAHENFFDAAWQVALVVDQKAMKSGLFYWEDGAVVRARRYWVGRQVHWEPAELAAVSAPPAASGGTRTDERNRDRPDEHPAARRTAALLAEPMTWLMLGLLAILLMFFIINLQVKKAQLATELRFAVRQLDERDRRFARELAFWTRRQLDAKVKPEQLVPIYREIIRLDPARRPAYQKLLPEVARLVKADKEEGD